MYCNLYIRVREEFNRTMPIDRLMRYHTQPLLTSCFQLVIMSEYNRHFNPVSVAWTAIIIVKSC